MTPVPAEDGEVQVTGPYWVPSDGGWSTLACPAGGTVVGEALHLSRTVVGFGATGAGAGVGLWCFLWLAAGAIATPTMSETAATATPANPIRRLTNTSRFLD
jgi:hypothetical protein